MDLDLNEPFDLLHGVDSNGEIIEMELLHT